MLKSVDVLIGLSLVMLVASMAVTVLTEAWNYFFNTRGRNLQKGLADLLHLVNPDFTQKALDQISGALLTHPLIRDGESRLGCIIHREELTTLLLSFATGGSTALEASVKTELINALKERGIADPDGTLGAIRDEALKIEKAQPGLAADVRANLAILQAAESRYVAAIHNWFDQTMDRVSHRFTLSTRTVTLCIGLLLALALQLDSIYLINRLWGDDGVRTAMVKEAEGLRVTTDSAGGPVPATANEQLYNFVSTSGLIPLPNYATRAAFAAFLDLRHLTGILFTSLLLSLGAPFWYSALQQLLQLRSKMAVNDDAQRKDRQSSTDNSSTNA